MKIKQRGFTLIELLVVIAIIGLLSTMAVVSLNSARGKARDARRVSDVKQLSTLIEMESTSNSATTKLEDSPGDCADGALTTACDGPGQISQFANFADPSGSATACDCDAGALVGGTCSYAISNEDGDGVAEMADYRICFALEEGAGSLPAGKNCVMTGAQVKSGSDCGGT